ncbi:hypothetical protein C8P64_0638 [Christiangramia gaetbulicola]|uniref:Lipoprotein n=1 Tax=Christiangramia gaetbulicola TaxID=703340 RepID=A0A2T6ALL7_9FLAO|nr:hypothetical protein [Christiangramia gaetbulicola]PTX44656.1 hypothetical protein C8P64_0638 [Christiangramia gaetbulicola]
MGLKDKQTNKAGFSLNQLISLMLFSLLLYGCFRQDYTYDFNEKWTLIEVEEGNNKLNDDFKKSSFLQHSVYPAIRFRANDSTVLWPGFKKEKNIFKFSIDRSFSKISFRKIDSLRYEESDRYMNLICQTYNIDKDDVLGRLSLSGKNNDINIRLVPTDRFIRQGKASKLD